MEDVLKYLSMCLDRWVDTNRATAIDISGPDEDEVVNTTAASIDIQQLHKVRP